MYIITQLTLIAACLANGALLVVLLRQRPSRIRALFALYVSAVTAWTGAILLNMSLMSDFVEHLIFAFATLGLTAQYWFAKLFPDTPLPRNTLGYSSLVIGFVFFIISFWNGALFSNLTFHPGGYTLVENGFLSAPYSLFVLVFGIAPIIFFARRRRTAPPVLRTQLTYLIIGFSLFLFVNVLTNSVLPVFFNIQSLNAAGPVFSVALSASVFYIIWRYQFLDIRSIVQRGLFYSVLLTCIIGIYFAALVTVGYILDLKTQLAAPISATLVMVAGIVTYAPLERAFRKLTDPIFFKDRYDYSAALQTLAATLAEYHTPYELTDAVSREVKRILRAEAVYFGEEPPHPYAISVPVHSAQEGRPLLGTFYLREKRSGDAYTSEDLRLLSTLASQMAIALEKAELYGQVHAYSQELEQKVANRTKHLEELRENQRRMTSDIAHAFQTPLTVLKSSLDRLTQTEVPDSHPRVQQMHQSIDAVSRLLYSFLRLSKLEALPDPKCDTVAISEVVTRVTEYVGTICEEYDIALEKDITPAVRVNGDAGQIEELLTNLLSNAVRHTRNRPVRRITVRLTRNASGVTLSVADTGGGIPAAVVPLIFERFYREREDRGRGFGLGLAICKRIVERHGGAIHVESTVDVGSTFTVRFPVADSDVESERDSTPAESR